MKCGLWDKISVMLSLGLWFILILLDILLIPNIYVCEYVYGRVLINTEGKRRSSDVTGHIRRLLGLIALRLLLDIYDVFLA